MKRPKYPFPSPLSYPLPRTVLTLRDGVRSGWLEDARAGQVQRAGLVRPVRAGGARLAGARTGEARLAGARVARARRGQCEQRAAKKLFSCVDSWAGRDQRERAQAGQVQHGRGRRPAQAQAWWWDFVNPSPAGFLSLFARFCLCRSMEGKPQIRGCILYLQRLMDLSSRRFQSSSDSRWKQSYWNAAENWAQLLMKCYWNIVKILLIFMQNLKFNSISNIYKLSVSRFNLKSV
jgi:hypothetical protein